MMRGLWTTIGLLGLLNQLSETQFGVVLSRDSITYDYDSVLEEIEGQDNKGDQEDTIDGRRFSWMAN